MLDLISIPKASYEEVQIGTSDEQHFADLIRFCKGLAQVFALCRSLPPRGTERRARRCRVASSDRLGASRRRRNAEAHKPWRLWSYSN